MARTCSVCRHAQRAAIDAALLAGESYRDIAGRCPVSKSALDRHKRDHIPAKLAKAPAAAAEFANSKAEAKAQRLAKAQAPAVPLVEAQVAAEEAEAGTLYDQLKAIGRDTRAILTAAKASSDHELSLKAIARLEKQLELLARLLGELDEGTKVAVGIQMNAAPSQPWDLSRLSPDQLQQLETIMTIVQGPPALESRARIIETKALPSPAAEDDPELSIEDMERLLDERRKRESQ